MNNTVIAIVAILLVAGGVFFYATQSQPAPTAGTQTGTMMDDETGEAMADTGTIVDVAVAAGTFETLVAAVQAAGLVETLSSDGPFTVFAPTDAAFAKLPAGTVEGLLEDPVALANILTYHVVAGKVMATDVVELDSAPTVQGQDISIEVVDGAVMLNGETMVIATDIAASNGVIHVIDTVLLPTE